MAPQSFDYGDAVLQVTGDVPASEAIKVETMPQVDIIKPGDKTITKIEIICKERMFEALKNELMSIGITGMTVSHVMGCGIQKGAPEYYRGIKIEPTLLPKIQVDIVVANIPASKVIESARKILYTGHIGDGKIFVYNCLDVVKVRTGETGPDALLDVE
jgi:Amt family ammonium transporter